MKVCRKCGKQALNDTDMFCSDCGGDLIEKSEFAEFVANNPEDDTYTNRQQTQTTTNYNYSSANQDEEYFPVDDIEKNKVYAVLSYFGILVLLPMIAAKDSGYAKFHANQGLLLLIANVIIDFATSILAIFGLLKIVTLIFMIMGIVNAAKGKAKRLPIFGHINLYK